MANIGWIFPLFSVNLSFSMTLAKLKKQLNKRSDLGFINKLHSSYPKVTVYLVGGAVRDYFQKKQIADLDFLVEGLSKEKLFDFLEKEGHLKDVQSRAFGVFIFRPEGEEHNFDIALPRSDRWTGQGYKDLEVQTGVSVKKDLARRDFTINAMAVDLRKYELIDKFKGRKDLEKGQIRAVGKPVERFKEDPCRILRGIRFSCQLGFEIESETFQAMKSGVKEIVKKLPDSGKKRVSEEVIGQEFLKSFDAEMVETIEKYDEIGLLKLLLPEISQMKGVKQPEQYHSEGDVFTHTMIALRHLQGLEDGTVSLKIKRLKEVGMLDEDFSIELKLALLFHDVGKPPAFTPPSEEKDRISFNEHDDMGAKMAEQIIDRLKLTVFAKGHRLHVNKKQVTWLIKKHMILVVAKPEEMRLSTIEKYFFNPDDRGKKLLTLSYCDITATIPPSGEPDYELLNKFLDQIDEVKGQVKEKQAKEKLPPPLLDGNDIMNILNLEPGPKIGEIKNEIRDKELANKLKSEKEATKWLKEKYL